MDELEGKIVQYFQTMGDGVQKNFQNVFFDLGLIKLLLIINTIGLTYLLIKSFLA